MKPCEFCGFQPTKSRENGGDRHDCISVLQAEVERLRAELDALKSKLPKTADGMPLIDGMRVYEAANPPFSMRPWPARVVYRPTATDRPFVVAGDSRDDFDPRECYSTREAAEAAKGRDVSKGENEHG